MAILPLQLARVSNLLRANVATQQITKTQQQMLELQNQLSSGKRLNAPSDNPGDAAIVQQLNKALEQRKAFATNIQNAASQLGEVDSTVGDLTDLLRQAQQIASANVGSDVTADQRASAAAVVSSLYGQALSLGNKQFNGMYLFGGAESGKAPFVEAGGGVKYSGSQTLLQNRFDESTTMSFMVGAADVFGAMSTRVEGAQDVSPGLTLNTRLSDLNGAMGKGMGLGSITVGNGMSSATIDLSEADTVGNVIDAINAAAVGGITASIGPNGNEIQLTGGAGDNISVNEVGGGTTAADFGILRTTGGGGGVPLDGVSVRPTVTLLTPLSALRNGQGIDTSGLVINNGLSSATVDLSSAVTVQDMLNAINASGTNVRAEINSSGTGINIFNPTQGSKMSIGENGGATATQLGVRSFYAATPLNELNLGKGVGRVESGDDFQVTRADGTTFTVQVGSAQTVQDIINAINTADGGGGVSAGLASTGNGLVLTDSTGGTGTLAVKALNYSTAAHDLGLDQVASGNVIKGKDVDPVQVDGIFGNLQRLREALQTNDQAGVTAAGEGLDRDVQRLTLIRGQTGARVQDLETRKNRLDEENIATKTLLSSLEDTDFTDAVSRFQTLQNALQASLQTGMKIMNMSLLDFLQ